MMTNDIEREEYAACPPESETGVGWKVSQVRRPRNVARESLA